MTTKSKKKAKSLSEKVADLILHPEGDENSEESESEQPRVVDFDEQEYGKVDLRSTEFRKKNITLLSEQSSKYRGAIASRKDFEQDSEEESGVSDAETEESEEDYEGACEVVSRKQPMANGNGKQQKAKRMIGKAATLDLLGDSEEEDALSDGDDGDSESADNMDFDSEEDDDDKCDDDEEDTDDDYNDDEENTDDATDMVKDKNNEAEVRKGQCVQNQLKIWEKLLEFRIQTQKLLTKSHNLPEPTWLQEKFEENEELKNMCLETSQTVAGLLNALLSLQSALTFQYSELKNSLKSTNKRPAPLDAPEEQPPHKRIAAELENRFTDFKPYRNLVLLKWDDRTKLLTPGAGAKKKSAHEEYDIVRKIDNALLSRETLIRKSQVLKSGDQQQSQDSVELNANDSENAESNEKSENVKAHIYDDSDFYHQQLRELIEYKASTTNSMAEITQQFVELQKVRQKMKKKVDTRASKGRKIRYTLHNKLVNFMAPNESSDTWNDESKDELYKSLFAS